MSAGRYSLRVHTESSKGARAGLDLRVLDAHSGEEREVWWQRAVETWPTYASYAKKTERQIPLFLLERR